ncbi:hypothetical protein RI367_006249 [Sorochytrium milnesiophthora]
MNGALTYHRNRSRSPKWSHDGGTSQDADEGTAAGKPQVGLTDAVVMRMGDWLYKATRTSDDSHILRNIRKDVIWVLGRKFDFTGVDANILLRPHTGSTETHLSTSPQAASLAAGKAVVSDIKHTITAVVAPAITSSSKQIFNHIKESLNGIELRRDDGEREVGDTPLHPEASKPIPVPRSAYRQQRKPTADVVSLHDSDSLAPSSADTDSGGIGSALANSLFEDIISQPHSLDHDRSFGASRGSRQLGSLNRSNSRSRVSHVDLSSPYGTSPSTAKEYDVIAQADGGVRNRKASMSSTPPSDLEDFLCNEPEATWRSSLDSTYMEQYASAATGSKQQHRRSHHRHARHNLRPLDNKESDLSESHVLIESLSSVPSQSAQARSGRQPSGGDPQQMSSDHRGAPLLYTIESSLADPDMGIISTLDFDGSGDGSEKARPAHQPAGSRQRPLPPSRQWSFTSPNLPSDSSFREDEFIALDEQGDEEVSHGVSGDEAAQYDITQIAPGTSSAQLRKLQSTVKGLLDTWQSHIWFSYRSGLHHCIGGSRYLSDTGWGCMHRTGQSMLCEALFRLKFGKTGFSWARLCRDTTLHRDYQAILELFEDAAHAPFSIHNIAVMGITLDKRIGEWFSPGTVAHALSRINQTLPQSPLRIYIASDTVVNTSQIVPASERRHDQEGVCVNTWVPVLILVPVRLGASTFNLVYLDHLVDVFEWPYCVGVAGGRKDASLYFTGYRQSDKHLLYYDPHTPQEYRPLSECKPPFEHYHTGTIRALPPDSLDPSMLLGFLISSKLEFEDFVSRVQQWTEHPLFVCTETEDAWDVDEDFGVLSCDDDTANAEEDWVVTDRH